MHTARKVRGVCSEANISNVGGEGNWSGWNQCKTMLQIASRYITSLTHIFNLSIRCEHYPKDWKYALLTPIHKGGDKCKTTNYRPISILPIISKILERWAH